MECDKAPFTFFRKFSGKKKLEREREKFNIFRNKFRQFLGFIEVLKPRIENSFKRAHFENFKNFGWNSNFKIIHSENPKLFEG